VAIRDAEQLFQRKVVDWKRYPIVESAMTPVNAKHLFPTTYVSVRQYQEGCVATVANGSW
jgi:hypothetical protein